MSMKRFMVIAIAAVQCVFIFQTASASAQKVQAATDNIRSKGRIIHNYGKSDYGSDDVILFDAADIKMLRNKLEQLETRIEQLRDR